MKRYLYIHIFDQASAKYVNMPLCIRISSNILTMSIYNLQYDTKLFIEKAKLKNYLFYQIKLFLGQHKNIMNRYI